MGILPIALFSNGHAFFVQHHDIHMKLQPYAVHATYTFDGAGSMAKQVRTLPGSPYLAPPLSR